MVTTVISSCMTRYIIEGEKTMTIINDAVKAFDKSFKWMVESVNEVQVQAMSSDATKYAVLRMNNDNTADMELFDMVNKDSVDVVDTISTMKELEAYITF